jgi:hypothetical protein
MAFVVTSYTFESLLTSAKMQIMMQNDVLLRSFSVGSHEGYHFTATASGHTHNGSDSATIVSAIAQANLKSTTGEVNTTNTNWTTLTLPGGEYGFLPRFKSAFDEGSMRLPNSVQVVSYSTYIQLRNETTASSVSALQRYIQASPPYKIGDVNWGHFIFTLVDKVSNDIISCYEAEDPPWAYNGYGKKDSVERIASVPHPFADYYNNLPPTYEINMLNLKDSNIGEWKNDLENKGRSILDDLDRINITKVQTFSEFDLSSVIDGFTNRVIIKKGSLK